MRQWTSILVCVGIGSTKTLAKLTIHVTKKCPCSKDVFNYKAPTAAQEIHLLQHTPAEEVLGEV